MLPVLKKPLPQGRGFFVGFCGLILAGGRGRRLGGVEKGLQSWHGRPLVSWAADALRPHCNTILISANRQLDDYRPWAEAIVQDQLEDGGPLAGLHAGLVWAASMSLTGLLVLPCDTPGVDASTMGEVVRVARRQPDRPVFFRLGERGNPLHGYYPVHLASALAQYLKAGERRAQAFVEAHNPHYIARPAGDPAFHNLNRSEDWPES
jgi:molybdopterin-guanine dinucleotide biosynthesis protein A